MSLQHSAKATPRELPPIDIPHSKMPMLGNRASSKPLKGMKGSEFHQIRIPTATSSSDELNNQDPYHRTKTSDVDYVQTDFRYLAIGSPVPDPEVEQEITARTTEDPEDLSESPTSASDDHQNSKSGNQNAGVYPAIKVDKCEEERRVGLNPPPNGGSKRQSGTDDVSSLDSPSTSAALLLLNPTPPLNRRRLHSKMVTYYQPSLTCSRSEGSIREAVSDDRKLLRDGASGGADAMYGTLSHGSVRSSCCSSPISASNTQDLLSPATFARQTLIGSLRASSDSRLSHDSLGQRSSASTPSPSVSPLSSPAARRRPTRLEPLSQSRSVDAAAGSRLPQI